MDSEDIVRSALELLTTAGDTQLQSLHPGLPETVASAQQWLRGPGVVGLGVAEKITDGTMTSDIALKVYVEQKRPLPHIDPNEVVPSTVALPSLPGPVPTDVEAIGKQRLQLLTTALRPVPGGYSIGTPEPATGTLGALVRKNGDPTGVYVLSCAHVLAASGTAKAGLSALQPGPDDGGSEATGTIAHLASWTVFDFTAGYNNLCDAAVAEVADPAVVSGLIALVGSIAPGTGPALARGQAVQKTGRTTDHTTGVIKDLDYCTFMIYPNPAGGVGDLGFRSQILCERYTDGGDSGALVLDTDKHAVGLHWCGSDSTSVFSPISFVLQNLGVTLIDSDSINPDGTLKAPNSPSNAP